MRIGMRHKEREPRKAVTESAWHAGMDPVFQILGLHGVVMQREEKIGPYGGVSPRLEIVHVALDANHAYEETVLCQGVLHDPSQCLIEDKFGYAPGANRARMCQGMPDVERDGEIYCWRDQRAEQPDSQAERHAVRRASTCSGPAVLHACALKKALFL